MHIYISIIETFLSNTGIALHIIVTIIISWALLFLIKEKGL